MKFFKSNISRRALIKGGLVVTLSAAEITPAQSANLAISYVLGRPTKNSITLNLIAPKDVTGAVEYGQILNKFTRKTETKNLLAGQPTEFELENLTPSAKVYYRFVTAGEFGKTSYGATAKSQSSDFSFTVQGDTHPERAGKMFNEELYVNTLKNISNQNPDFHILLGDDFSIDPIIAKNQATRSNIEKIYATHRNWLQIVGEKAPIFLVNGNHEQAAKYLLDGTDTNPAVLAGNARLKYFALPTPNDFYTGDQTEVPFVGKPRDYYSWTWADALFITLDPYWHSKYAVDNVAGVTSEQEGGNKKSGAGASKTQDLWQVGIGDEQYFWLKQTLENSNAKYIFLFTHHVLGTGRGAVEISTNYEWGGKDPKGTTTFKIQRPNWEMPIHDLLVKHKASILFQGHDHIFVTQQRDGLIYQSMPNPADDTFSMFNEAAYLTGKKAPNSGHVRVSINKTSAKVQYFLSARAKDPGRKNLQIAHSYSVNPRQI
jgi:hypothetical protein